MQTIKKGFTAACRRAGIVDLRPYEEPRAGAQLREVSVHLESASTLTEAFGQRINVHSRADERTTSPRQFE
jgi:hypothetical protein